MRIISSRVKLIFEASKAISSAMKTMVEALTIHNLIPCFIHGRTRRPFVGERAKERAIKRPGRISTRPTACRLHLLAMELPEGF